MSKDFQMLFDYLIFDTRIEQLRKAYLILKSTLKSYHSVATNNRSKRYL